MAILTDSIIQNSVSLTVTGVPLYNERKIAIGEQKLVVTYDYNQSIHGATGQISAVMNFNQPFSPSCVISASKTIDIMAQANNNLPFMFYSEQDLAKKQQVEDIVNVA